MSFQPLGKRVLVEFCECEKTTASGIIIPDNASKEKPQIASVVAVGSEVSEVVAGDKIAFAKYSGTELNLDGKKFLVLNLEDVLGVIK